MKASSLATLIAGLALSATLPGFGQTTVNSDPVGFVTVSVPASSDAILAVPMYRTAAFKGVIQSISGGNTIEVAGTSPGWTANQFVQSLPTQTNTYAVLLATGTKEGMIAKVTANGGNTVTVQFDAGDDLTGVKTEAVDGAGNGDHIDIIPYWTPSSLFSGLPTSGIEVSFVSLADVGVNLAPSTIFELAGANWLDQNTAENVNHAPLGFGYAFVLRNSTASPVSISIVGSVPMTKHRGYLKTLAANIPQDNRVGYLSPIPEVIGNVGLGTTAGDELHVYDNTATGFNKAPVQILEFTGSLWLDQNTAANVTTTFLLQPGQGYLLRRVGTPTPSAYVWSDLPSYLTP